MWFSESNNSSKKKPRYIASKFISDCISFDFHRSTKDIPHCHGYIVGYGESSCRKNQLWSKCRAFIEQFSKMEEHIHPIVASKKEWVRCRQSDAIYVYAAYIHVKCIHFDAMKTSENWIFKLSGSFIDFVFLVISHDIFRLFFWYQEAW